jgi:hypothetical protein
MKAKTFFADDIPILGQTAKSGQRVEIARSFSYKLNAGNYESRDFFCSEKSECAIEDAHEVSAALYAFCKQQVLESVKEYRADMMRQRGPQKSEVA